MILTSRPLAFFIFFVLFGGIAISSMFGWWQTESTKVPAAYTEGEFAGEANPADIRGSYTFGDIARSFDISSAILAQAFHVTSNEPAAFAVKDLESLYLESGYEIGVDSVRLFVAFYLGLPFDITSQDIYLPEAAADILQSEAVLSPDRGAYLQTHAVDVRPAAEGQPSPARDEEAPSQTESGGDAPDSAADRVVRGKTVFGDLLAWGVPRDAIEQIIGGPLPDPAMKIKDYANTNGLDFETIKEALQAEVDKAQR